MYIDTINKELKEYFNILSKDYPTFINKYIETKTMQRLKGIGQFCGCDYTKLHSPKFYYSRLDHSIACALMTWHFTNDEKQTLAALFHDLGTPAFSHCIDFLMNDAINQESSEIDIKKVISNSEEITKYLNEDNITIDEVTDLEQYTILENKKPKLCVDRLEGVLHTALIWCHFWSLEDIKYVYENIEVLINEDNEKEIGFTNIDKANKFFEAIFKYSIVLQQNEDKFTMQFIADCLKELVSNNLKIEDLYIKSEQEILTIIRNNDKLKDKWKSFAEATTLNRTNNKPNGIYYVSLEVKKRYVIPLIIYKNKIIRLNEISEQCKILLEEYLNYSDSKYCNI